MGKLPRLCNAAVACPRRTLDRDHTSTLSPIPPAFTLALKNHIRSHFTIHETKCQTASSISQILIRLPLEQILHFETQ